MRRNPHRPQDDARVEVDVRIELALDEIRVLERDTLERHGDLEQRLVADAELLEHLVARLAQHLGARVVVLVHPVAEAHEPERVLPVLGAVDELGNAVDRTDFGEHGEHRLVGATVRRSPQAGDAGGDASVRVGARRARQPHGRGRGVLLVVRVEDEDAVERARHHRVHAILLARHREQHVEEVFGVVQVVAGIDERLTDRKLVGHGGDRRHLRDQAERRHHPLVRIVEVEGVVVERRERADHPDHHRHRMRVATKAAEEEGELLVHHGVHGDVVLELAFLLGTRQLAV